MAEMVAIQMQVPREWLPDLKDQAAFLEILGLGLEEYRMQRALERYARGGMSFGAAAQQAGVSQTDLSRFAYARGNGAALLGSDAGRRTG